MMPSNKKYFLAFLLLIARVDLIFCASVGSHELEDPIDTIPNGTNRDKKVLPLIAAAPAVAAAAIPPLAAIASGATIASGTIVGATISTLPFDKIKNEFLGSKFLVKGSYVMFFACINN